MRIRHRSRFTQTAQDVFEDAFSTCLERGVRTLLLALAFAVGCAGFVASVGFNESAKVQISLGLLPSDLNIVDGSVNYDHRDLTELRTALGRLRAIPSVAHAGMNLPLNDVKPSRFAEETGLRGPAGAALIGVDADWLRATDPHLLLPDVVNQLDSATPQPVAFVGMEAAQRLNISCVGPGCVIWIGSRSLSVLGYLSSADPEISNSVLVPFALAVELSEASYEAHLRVRTKPGQARPVAEALPVTMSPDAPGKWRVQPVLDLASARRGVQTSLDRTSAILAFVALCLSGLAIGITLSFAALTRAPEIGLRRALGQSRMRIWVLFVLEGATIGFVGGVVGGSLGVLCVVAACWYLGWTPVLDPITTLASVALGCLVGLLASTYPAVRAARTDPATAVR